MAADRIFLESKGLSLVFPGGVRALAGLDLRVREGEFVSIVGPSGCGKSTFLRLAAGLLTPTEGTVRTGGGHDPRDKRWRRQVAFVFQQPTLLPWRTVERNVALPIELRGEGGSAAAARVREKVRLVGLEEFTAAHPHQLSGGMQMRVSLARALVTAPGLLLLDEPFAALDDITRQRLNEELLALRDRQRFTALFVTHNVSEAVFLGERVLVMSARPGRFVEELRVPFAYPRGPELRAEAEFAALCGEVSAMLRAAYE